MSYFTFILHGMILEMGLGCESFASRSFPLSRRRQREIRSKYCGVQMCKRLKTPINHVQLNNLRIEMIPHSFWHLLARHTPFGSKSFGHARTCGKKKCE